MTAASHAPRAWLPLPISPPPPPPTPLRFNMAERMVLATGNDAKLGGGTLKNYHIHFKKLKVCVAAAADEHRAIHPCMNS